MLLDDFVPLEDTKSSVFLAHSSPGNDETDFSQNVDCATQEESDSDDCPGTSDNSMGTEVRLAVEAAISLLDDGHSPCLSLAESMNCDPGPKKTVRLRAYQFIGKTSEIIYSIAGDDDECSTMVGRVTGPGTAFIEEVEDRTFATSKLMRSFLGVNAVLHPSGCVDQQLIEDFAATHPYFASARLESDNRELYREKMAFYFVKRGLSRKLQDVDIVATAVGLVAECLIRYYRSTISPPGIDTEVLFVGEDNAISKAIIGFIESNLPSTSIVRVTRKSI
ncbi:hypothetical protein MBLNU459_g3304t1 [Dothideomycetes sp. NU459]